MNSFADFEYLFSSLTPLVRVIVTSDATRNLNSMMSAAARPIEEVQVLLFATSADVWHDDHVDPHVVVDNLVRHARKFLERSPRPRSWCSFASHYSVGFVSIARTLFLS